MRRRWEYGVAYVPEPGEPDGHVTPVLDEATALAFIEEHEALGLMYRRPEPKPWQLVRRPR